MAPPKSSTFNLRGPELLSSGRFTKTVLRATMRKFFSNHSTEHFLALRQKGLYSECVHDSVTRENNLAVLFHYCYTTCVEQLKLCVKIAEDNLRFTQRRGNLCALTLGNVFD